MTKTPKRPRDPNQLARYVVELATGELPKTPEESEMAKRGRTGGKIGGKARAESLQPAERSKIASRAAAARWKRSAN